MKKIIYFILLYLSAFPIIGQQLTFNKRYIANPAQQIYTATCFGSVIATDTAYYVSGIFSDSLPPFKTGLFFGQIDLSGNIVKETRYFMPHAAYMGAWSNVLTPLRNGFVHVENVRIDSTSKIALTFIDSTGNISAQVVDELDSNHGHLILSIHDYLNLSLSSTNIYSACNSDFYIDSTNVGAPPSRIWLTKSDMNGNNLWNRYYGSSSLTNINPVISWKGSDTVLLAYCENNLNLSEWGEKARIRILVLDTAGNYVRDYYNSDENQDTLYGVYTLLRTKDQGYVYVGDKAWSRTTYPYEMEFKGVAVKIDSTGTEAWRYINPGDSSNSQPIGMRSAIEISDGSIIAAGNVLFTDVADSPHVFMSMAKLKDNGGLIWQRRYTYFNTGDASIQQNNFSVKECPDKGFILCGQSINNSGEEGWLVKTDSFGCLIPGCQIWDGIKTAADDSIEIKVYPNPATDFINLIFHAYSRSAVMLSVRDVLGRSVFQCNIKPDITTMIDTKDFANGEYVLCFEDEGGRTWQRKIIVTK